MVLAAFVIIQGIYHSAGALGFSLFAKGILEPLSLAVLLFFGVIYLINRLKAKEEDVKEVQWYPLKSIVTSHFLWVED